MSKIFLRIDSVIPFKIFARIPPVIPARILQNIFNISTIPARRAFAEMHPGIPGGTYPVHFNGIFKGFPLQIRLEKLL